MVLYLLHPVVHAPLDLIMKDVEMVTVTGSVNSQTAQEKLVDPVHLRLHLLLHPLETATLQGRRASLELIAAVVGVTSSKEIRNALRQ